MSKDRMEAFSDGVFAVVITIMVLEIKSPRGAGLAGLRSVVPAFCTYALSFVFVGIYWNNHHHLLQAAQHVNGSVLWANLHLLFWLSLTPFATAWMGEHPFASWPVALYGALLLLSGCAYYILTKLLIAQHGRDSRLAQSIRSDLKTRVSAAIYAVSIPFSFWKPWIACTGYVIVAILWLAPDPRIEKNLPDG